MSPFPTPRYEVRDYAAKSSAKKFHIWDRQTNLEVFHTDSRERADAIVALAGDEPITQHLKDYGHQWDDSGRRGRCKACKRGIFKA
jgi:hypothetical protein